MLKVVSRIYLLLTQRDSWRTFISDREYEDEMMTRAKPLHGLIISWMCVEDEEIGMGTHFYTGLIIILIGYTRDERIKDRCFEEGNRMLFVS